MYNPGSYSSQSGQATPMPVPPPFQQLPPARAPPPPPRHHHQLQHDPLLQAVNRQAPPPLPSHVGQPGPSPYRYGPSPLPAFLHVQSGVMSNAGQSYFHHPPPVHGGTTMSSVYPTTQQNSTHLTHLGNQNLYPVQPPVAPAYGLPPPPRLLPPSAQGQSSYRATVLHSPQRPDVVQGSQHILLPPPPPPPIPASSLSTSVPFETSIHSSGGNSHVPSITMPPQPPPPSSSPPHPPPPPPPTTPFLSDTSNLPPLSDSNPDSIKLSGCQLKTSSSIDEKLACSNGSDKLPEQRSYLDRKVVSDSQAGYLAGNSSLSEGNMILDLPPPPSNTRRKTCPKN